MEVKSNMSDLCNRFTSEDTTKSSVEESWHYFKDAVFKVMDKKDGEEKSWSTVDTGQGDKANDAQEKADVQTRFETLNKKPKDSQQFLKNSTERNKIHSSYHNYLNTLLDPEQDTSHNLTSKIFWKYIKARKKDTRYYRDWNTESYREDSRNIIG